jgi:HK97 family phage portal protein
MGWLDRIFGKTTENRDQSTFDNPAAWVGASFGSTLTHSGVRVTESTALGSIPVLACVRLISDSIATVPLNLYRRLGNGGSEQIGPSSNGSVLARLASLFSTSPCPEITAFQFKELLQSNVCLWGNAYAEKEFDKAGRVIGLWPLLPDRTWPERIFGTNRVRYHTSTPDGNALVLPSSKVLHIAGMGFDGLVGYSPIRLAAQALGRAMATEEFGQRFFGQGMNPGGVLEHPAKLSDMAYKRLEKKVREREGLPSVARTLILEEGMKFSQAKIALVDAQFIESMKFGVTEAARLFGVPPHMIADLDRSTNNNIEHQGIDFTTFTIAPHATRWEQCLDLRVLTDGQRGNFFFRYDLDALKRGDRQSRFDTYSRARQWGIYSVNEIRRMEDMNPIDGGDEFLRPANMQVIGAPPQDADPSPAATAPAVGGGLDAA